MSIDYDKYCNRCEHVKFEPDRGVICGLTNAKPDFGEHCDDFKLDFEKEKDIAKGLAREKYVAAEEGMTGGEWVGVFLCWPYALFQFFAWMGKYPRKVKQVCALYAIAFIISLLIGLLQEASRY